MAKIKSGETLSLDKSNQKKLVKQTKKLKKNIQKGKISIRRPKRLTKNAEQPQSRGLIYIGHIPHGFYEDEMKKYFKQFGAVTNVKLCRSRKTGNSKGFGYIEFSHPEVAKIAAESMNNYLMFKKRIVAEYVPSEKRPKGLFKGRINSVKRNSTKIRREKQQLANFKIGKHTIMRRNSDRLSRLNKKLQKLSDLGIEYDLEPSHLPKEIQQKEKTETIQGSAPVFQQDPYDSDIEVKVPVIQKSKKSRASKQTTVGITKKTPKIMSKHVISITTKLTPATVSKKTPKATKQTPKASKQTPTAIKQTPKAIKQTPKAIKQTPKATKKSPKTPKQSPKQTPKEKLVKRKLIQK